LKKHFCGTSTATYGVSSGTRDLDRSKILVGATIGNLLDMWNEPMPS